MLKQLAPIAVMPPSPKNSACTTIATDTASIAAHGPSTTVANPIPTACPVVPPGSGRLNIMITNENAANSESSGTSRVCSAFFTRSQRHVPERRRAAVKRRAGSWAQVSIRYMHA